MIRDFTETLERFWEKEQIPKTYHHAESGETYTVYPPSSLRVIDHEKQLVAEAAKFTIRSCRKERERGGLILPTGATFEPIYAHLARNHRNDIADLLQSRPISNLDEVLPLQRGSEIYWDVAYEAYILTHLLNKLEISAGNWIHPDCTTIDPQGNAIQTGRQLQREKWAIALMGIGPDKKEDGTPASSHIAFIPPHTDPEDTMMVVDLDEGTRAANHETTETPLEAYPERAITMGPKDIGRANQKLLIATGSGKRENIAQTLTTPVDLKRASDHTLLWPNQHVILDPAAAQLLLARIT